MSPHTSHRLLIYHSDSKIYERIISKKLPGLKIQSATRPEEALGFIEEAEIILAWEIPDEVLKRARQLKWFASIPTAVLLGCQEWVKPASQKKSSGKSISLILIFKLDILHWML